MKAVVGNSSLTNESCLAYNGFSLLCHYMENSKEIVIEVREERELTEAEMETLASLFFSWWKRECEQHSQERLESKPREQ